MAIVSVRSKPGKNNISQCNLKQFMLTNLQTKVIHKRDEGICKQYN